MLVDPEEMDVVELVADVAVEPGWVVAGVAGPRASVDRLTQGERGMVVHRRDQTPPLFDVEFLDAATGDPRVLATLRPEQIRVVERDTLGEE
ncbi:MAG: hypothetical protein ACRDHE_11730 [Ktedonobacterales bacterium]